MNISIILGHPRPGSFNHAIAQTAFETLQEDGHNVAFHDLYQEGFDPVMTAEEEQGALPPTDPLVVQHCDEIVAAHGVIIIHPNWFFQPPAMVKGWVDRVLRTGIAYGYQDGKIVGLLKASSGLVFNTANTPAEPEQGLGNPLDTLWRQCILEPAGLDRTERHLFSPVLSSSPEQRRQWLSDVRVLVRDQFAQDAAWSGLIPQPANWYKG